MIFAKRLKSAVSCAVIFALVVQIVYFATNKTYAEYEYLKWTCSNGAENLQNANGFTHTAKDGEFAVFNKKIKANTLSVDFRIQDISAYNDGSKKDALYIGLQNEKAGFTESACDALIFSVVPFVKNGKNGIQAEAFYKSGSQSFLQNKISTEPYFVEMDIDGLSWLNLSLRKDGDAYLPYFNGVKLDTMGVLGKQGFFAALSNFDCYASFAAGAEAGTRFKYNIVNINGIFTGNRNEKGSSVGTAENLESLNWSSEAYNEQGQIEASVTKTTEGLNVVNSPECSETLVLSDQEYAFDQFSFDFSFSRFSDYSVWSDTSITSYNETSLFITGNREGKNGLTISFKTVKKDSVDGVMVKVQQILDYDYKDGVSEFVPVSLNKGTKMNCRIVKLPDGHHISFNGTILGAIDLSYINSSFLEDFENNNCTAMIYVYSQDKDGAGKQKELAINIHNINGMFAGGSELAADETDVAPDSEEELVNWTYSGGSKGTAITTGEQTDNGVKFHVPYPEYDESGNAFNALYQVPVKVEGYTLGLMLSEFPGFMTAEVWTPGADPSLDDHVFSMYLLNEQNLNSAEGIRVDLRPFRVGENQGVRIEVMHVKNGTIVKRLDNSQPPFRVMELKKDTVLKFQFRKVNGMWRFFFNDERYTGIDMTVFDDILDSYSDHKGYVLFKGYQNHNKPIGITVTRINDINFTKYPLPEEDDSIQGQWSIIRTSVPTGGSAYVTKDGTRTKISIPQNSNSLLAYYDQPVAATRFGVRFKFDSFPYYFKDNDWGSELSVSFAIMNGSDYDHSSGIITKVKPYEVTQTGAKGIRIECFYNENGIDIKRLDSSMFFLPADLALSDVYIEFAKVKGKWRFYLNEQPCTDVDFGLLPVTMEELFPAGEGNLFSTTYSAKAEKLDYTVLKVGNRDDIGEASDPAEEFGLSQSNCEETPQGLNFKLSQFSNNLMAIYEKPLKVDGFEMYFRLPEYPYYFTDWSKEVRYTVALTAKAGSILNKGIAFYIRLMEVDGQNKLYIEAAQDGDFANRSYGKSYINAEASQYSPLKLSIKNDGMWRVYVNDVPVPEISLIGFNSNVYSHYQSGEGYLHLGLFNTEAKPMRLILSKINQTSFCDSETIIEPLVLEEREEQEPEQPPEDNTPPQTTSDADSASSESSAEDSASNGGNQQSTENENRPQSSDPVKNLVLQGGSINDRYEKGDAKIIHKGSAAVSYNKISENGYDMKLGHGFTLSIPPDFLLGIEQNDIFKVVKQELYPDTFAKVKKDESITFLRGFMLLCTVNDERFRLMDKELFMSYELPDDILETINGKDNVKMYYLSDNGPVEVLSECDGKTVTFKGDRFANEYVLATNTGNLLKAVPLSYTVSAEDEPDNFPVWIIIASAGVLLAAGAAFTFIILIKKKKIRIGRMNKA